MYIKQIIIQGFKSYKEQTVIEPFSAKHNVIVGRNGSGKSNFFAAIRFVLSDAYTQLGREERQALLHEGSGSAVMSAYVELIFDNTDGRFPTQKDQTILRRTIGLKKDEYTLDYKNVTKTDVLDLLETAGFSRANPYYIVPQGRVTALTNMKDSERLKLLKDVAGTQVYESRRSESIKIMAESDNKRSKIDESMTVIQTRLDELEEEKEELRKYQERDREKRCLEYAVHFAEQQRVEKQVESLEEERMSGVENSDEAREKFLAGEEELARLEGQITEQKQQLEFLRVDRKELENDRREAAKAKAQAEFELSRLVDGQSAARHRRSQNEAALREVRNAIQQREYELQQLLPGYNNSKEHEDAIKARLQDATTLMQRLYDKQGRSARFRSKADRDKWLTNEINQSNMALATRKAVAMQTNEEIVQLESEIGQMDQALQEMRQRLEHRGDDVQSFAVELQNAKDQRDGLMDQRKELWREEAKLDSVISNAQHELDRSERFLSHMMDQNTSRGLAAVRRIKRQHNLEGVYGTLGELFTVSDRYKTAVEVTAGNSLFHYVVDNEETATRVLEILQKEKSGRVTFMPLNRLHPGKPNIPQANDAVHLVTRLTYDKKYDVAFQQVFGRTIVCPNLQVAAQYARSHSVSAITADGDRADRKGALTGGYHDPKQSRMDGLRNVQRWRGEYDGHRARLAEIKQNLERLDQEVTRAVGNLQKVEQRRQQMDNSYGPLRQELRNKNIELQNKRDTLDGKYQARMNVDAALRELGEQQSAYQMEMQSPFQKALTNAEEQQLDGLGTTIRDLRKQYAQLSASRADLQARKQTLEVELGENLRPRLESLQSLEFESGSTDDHTSEKLDDQQRVLDRIQQSLASLKKKLVENEGSIDQRSTMHDQLEQTRLERQQQQEEVARVIEKQQRRIERGTAARAGLLAQLEGTKRAIRDLGVLPEEAFTKYENMDSATADKRLQKVTKALKGFAHVNKKALEQYQNFTKQRELLIRRRRELDQGQQSIEELIETLDRRKDEAIERTFKQVSKAFKEVFEKLVPAGLGRLVIQRRNDPTARMPDEEPEEEEEVRGPGGGVENYIGVGISVSFNSKHDDQQRIQQLSGGQKSLCALALIFAIQACDPMPFYLFDEVDANLDAQYRTAVAQMLHESSQTAQFICTTFRPEMVLVAEKCYGVTYTNKTSSIDVVGVDDALQFVDGQGVTGR